MNPLQFLYGPVRQAVSDPRNYRFLQEAAGNVLSRAIPQNVNWGSIPTSFLNTLTDISRMPVGAAREAARNDAKRTLVRSLVQPPVRPRGTITGSGALRAPAVGTARGGFPTVVSAPSTPLPGGGPFGIDYALRRATGFTGSPQQIANKLIPFPLDNPLTRLQATGRYYQRQLGNVIPDINLSAGVDTAKGIFRNLQNLGPTALNPLRTREPTTLLGKAGKLVNPLNPLNVIDAINPMPGVSLGARAAAGLGLTGGVGLGASAGIGTLATIGADMLFPRSTADGTLDAARRGGFISALPLGTRDESGRYFAGNDYGFQSPESFNKLYGTRLPTVRRTPPEQAAPSSWEDGSDSGGFTSDVSVPPAATPGRRPPTAQPAAATTPAVLQQAGQVVDLPPPPGSMFGQVVISNGAGVPAQRQNVQQRALSQEVLNAAQQYSAPTGIPLPSFYAGQQQLGRSMQQTGELQRRLTEEGGASGMTEEALAQWVRANPGLAYRELMRLQGGR